MAAFETTYRVSLADTNNTSRERLTVECEEEAIGFI
jgi:hypothetical protein